MRVTAISPGLRRALVVIGVYLFLALVLTYPVGWHFTTHLPGDGGDDPPLAWNLWWVKHALLDLGTNPFDCRYLFYPIGINLAFYTLTVLNGALSIPLQSVFGLVASSNLILWSSFVVGGYGTYLLVLYLLAGWKSGRMGKRASRLPDFQASHLAAFVAGLVYAFSSSKLFYAALGQFNIASSQWIPFYVLFLFKMRRNPTRWRYPLWAALFLLFQAWAEMTYASFLIIFTALCFLCDLLGWASTRKLESRSYLGVVGALGLLGLVFVLGLSPILYMMLPDMLVEGDFFVQGSGFAEVFSADPLGLFIPTRLHPLFGSLVGGFDFQADKGQHLFLGYVVLILALYALVRRSGARFWGIAAFIFLVLCLGPVLSINGHSTGLPLPFLVLQRLPFFKGNRYPGRFGVMVVLSLAVLVGFGLERLLKRIPHRRSLLLAACCSLLILFEHLSIPLPLSDMQVPEVYHLIAAEEGDFAVLDIPLAWRNGFRITGTLDPIIMFEQFYQTVHRKRILAGNTSRNPEFKFQYFTALPAINHLIALETGHRLEASEVERDKALAAEVLRFFDIRYVVVHTAQAGPDLVPYVEATMPVERFYGRGGIVAYRVVLPPPPDEVNVDLGEGKDLARLHLGEGWSSADSRQGWVWAQRKEVRFFAHLPGGTHRMTWRALAPGPGQTMAVVVNGQTFGPLELAEGWGEYELEIPAINGLNEFRFRFSHLFPVDEVHLGQYDVGQTGLVSPVSILVESAGQEVGDFGHIYVNGRNVSPEGRGYNLAVVNPTDGKVETVTHFDTHLDEAASQEMAYFLNAIPRGKIVAVAAADEASRLLGEEAVGLLGTIGASGDLRGRFRWGQAIIGVKGARPGQALEALDLLKPVSVQVGEGVSQPHLAAAFDWVRFDHNSLSPRVRLTSTQTSPRAKQATPRRAPRKR